MGAGYDRAPGLLERLDVRAGPCQGEFREHPRQHLERYDRLFQIERGRVRRLERNQHLGIIRHIGKAEPRRQHARHGVGLPVEIQSPPHHARVAAETLPPQRIGEKRDRDAAGAAVGGDEISAGLRSDPQKREEIRSDHGAVKADRAAGAGQRVLVKRIAGNRRERPSAFAPGDHVRRDDGAAAAGARPLGHPHQPAGIAIRQWAEEQGVDRGKDRRGGADPQGQGQHCGERESGTAPQPAHPVPDVLQECVEHGETALFAICLFRGLRPAQPDQRLPPCFRGAHSRAQVVGDMHLEIALDLFRQFALAPVIVEQAGKAADENAQVSHAGPPGYACSLPSDRNRAMTAAVSCHSPASFSICLRPARVRR